MDTQSDLIKTATTPAGKVRALREYTSRVQTEPEFRKSFDYDKYMEDVRAVAPLLPRINKSFKGLKIAIHGHKVQLVGTWDPFECDNGLPGSEECAVYASQELANQGHQVTVYMDPPEKSIWRSPFSNPRWLPADQYYNTNNTDHYDLVLMWRNSNVDAGRKRGTVVFFWPHDSPWPQPKPGIFPKFDGLCMLSKHHRNQYNEQFSNFNKLPYTICGNGVVLSQFEHPMSFTNPYSIGYFSNYARGLVYLMMLWPEIRKEFPEATLSICYGRQTWNTMSQSQFDWVIGKIAEYSTMGVTEHGKVGHQELANIMQATSVWAYPCIANSETFCITATKCQLAGMIPVVTHIGALAETVHPDAPHIPILLDNNDLSEYKKLLLGTLHRIKDTDPDVMKVEREKYIQFAKGYAWPVCVGKWLTLYEKSLKGKKSVKGRK